MPAFVVFIYIHSLVFSAPCNCCSLSCYCSPACKNSLPSFQFNIIYLKYFLSLFTFTLAFVGGWYFDVVFSHVIVLYSLLYFQRQLHTFFFLNINFTFFFCFDSYSVLHITLFCFDVMPFHCVDEEQFIMFFTSFFAISYLYHSLALLSLFTSIFVLLQSQVCFRSS